MVLNVHAGTDMEGFAEAADSILAQAYDPLELVVVCSDAPEVEAWIADRYGTAAGVEIVSLETDEGLSAARNAGARAASGDIVVFTDDDVVVRSGWIEALVAVYEAETPTGVGGHVEPIWPGDTPGHLPPEFYWLVGVTHPGFVETAETQRVRNTFGCNISFDREAFLAADGFREDLGKNQQNPLQGEEAELCERIDGEIWYTPAAIVDHRVDRGQLSLGYLHRRAFWQGYSKAALAEDMGAESTFLRGLVFDSLPRRIREPTLAGFVQISVLGTLTAAVGFGFLYGRFRPGAGHGT